MNDQQIREKQNNECCLDFMGMVVLCIFGAQFSLWFIPLTIVLYVLFGVLILKLKIYKKNKLLERREQETRYFCDMPLDYSQDCEHLRRNGNCQFYLDYGIQECPNKWECEQAMGSPGDEDFENQEGF